MSNIIAGGAAAMVYAASVWNRSSNTSGILDTAKIPLEDARWFAVTLPSTLYDLAKDASVNYDKCQRDLKNIEKASWLPRVEIPIRSMMCEGYKYQAILYALAGSYVVYKLIPYAKCLFKGISYAASFFGGIFRKKELVSEKEVKSSKVVQEQDLNKEIHFLNSLIQMQGLVAESISYNRGEGLVVQMSTTQVLEDKSIELEKEYNVEMIENEDGELIALEIKRDGYVVEIASSDK